MGLVVSYEAVALSKEAAGDAKGALEYREKCLETSRASGDPAKESKAQYDLGQAHEKIGELEHLKHAVSHYEEHLALAEKAADVEAQGAACYALAQVYQRMQEGDQSLQYLQRFL